MQKNTKIAIIIIVIVVLVLIGIAVARNSSVRLGPGLNVTKTTTQCSDSVDNDGDGRCDFNTTTNSCRDGSILGDSGCTSKSDNSEASCVAGSTTCGVGACQRSSTCSNDRVVCTPGTPSSEICTDTIDNDCDGLTNEGCATNQTGGNQTGTNQTLPGNNQTGTNQTNTTA